MKILFLVRHAKARRVDAAVPDRERLLDDRGREDASEIGQRLRKQGAKPDLLVSSPALRALTTAQLIADEIGYPRKDIVVDERLYAARPDELRAVVSALDDKVEGAMLFGHNPEFTDLARLLSMNITEMPTCGVAELRFDSLAWADALMTGPSEARLHAPK